uniref:Cl581_1 n=1 Tax=Arundo donax TaxID=35708 RepID=A0A0A9CRS7_ARUDO
MEASMTRSMKKVQCLEQQLALQFHQQSQSFCRHQPLETEHPAQYPLLFACNLGFRRGRPWRRAWASGAAPRGARPRRGPPAARAPRAPWRRRPPPPRPPRRAARGHRPPPRTCTRRPRRRRGGPPRALPWRCSPLPTRRPGRRKEKKKKR